MGRVIALLFHDRGTRRVGGSGQQLASAVLYPREGPTTHCTGGCEGLRVFVINIRSEKKKTDKYYNLPVETQR